ncbi:MAG: ornithine carbamoyltransferase [Pseudomonadota bacterium]
MATLPAIDQSTPITPSGKQDFLTLMDLPADALKAIVADAIELRRAYERGERTPVLAGRTAALILELNSTRTRVGFEAGMQQLGGQCLIIDAKNSQLGRGEPICDTARVLSEMLDVIVIRTLEQAKVQELARWASVPVINAMTAQFHPLQLLADIQTFEELRGSIEGAKVAFIGDGYNMCHSYLNASRQWNFDLQLACPDGYRPDPGVFERCERAVFAESVEAAVSNADLVVTDVWSSMGHEADAAAREAAFSGYQVTEALLDRAKPEVLFMHCLPAHRGEEVNETILDDPRSVVFREAGNRLHSQKALLKYLLT